jgi:hypothetical protein
VTCAWAWARRHVLGMSIVIGMVFIVRLYNQE